jgi:hypothetical protein
MFTCNITGDGFDLEEDEKKREGGLRFGYNIRQRAILYCLIKQLYGESKILEDLDTNTSIKGIGLMDGDWANMLDYKFDFTSTYSHKKPLLNINDTEDVEKYKDYDFVLCSDVLQHLSPYPDIQISFNNIYSMLKSGGFLILSVPFVYDDYTEKYPSLYDYKLEINTGGKTRLLNTTKDNENEVFENLVFYGEPDLKNLEMRMFSYDSLKKFLKNAGFINVTFNKPDRRMRKHGIFWDNMCSLVITAFKPL